MGCMECIGKTPFASLIATMIVFVGVAIFCGTLYTALQLIIKDVFRELFGFSVQWVEAVQVVFVVIGVVMAVFAILVLIFGILATGATRRNVYSGEKCIMGGRVSAAFFMVMSYILNLAWLLIMSVTVIPIILYVSIYSICNVEVYNKNPGTSHYCFNLTQYGVYRNHSYPPGVQPEGKDHLCDMSDLKRMCDSVAEAGPLFCAAFAGAVLIVLGLIHFMVTLSSNYTRIRISKELTDYRDAAEMDEIDLSLPGSKSRY
ncbi:proteolipid protein DM beta-like [Liolophura sinensis]|uniref:proteolipid protein DM beta-like n=1 Tax=Liolophura sinensis TaxID=3198878 RepID=UPI003159343F